MDFSGAELVLDEDPSHKWVGFYLWFPGAKPAETPRQEAFRQILSTLGPQEPVGVWGGGIWRFGPGNWGDQGEVRDVERGSSEISAAGSWLNDSQVWVWLPGLAPSPGLNIGGGTWELG